MRTIGKFRTKNRTATTTADAGKKKKDKFELTFPAPLPLLLGEICQLSRWKHFVIALYVVYLIEAKRLIVHNKTISRIYSGRFVCNKGVGGLVMRGGKETQSSHHPPPPAIRTAERRGG